MARSASTVTLLLLAALLVAAQTAHAARGLLQDVEAPSPLQGVPGHDDDHAPAGALAGAPWLELVREDHGRGDGGRLGFVEEHVAAAPASASPNSALSPAGSVPSSALGLLWRRIWWFDEPYCRPAPGSIIDPY
ncbi:hypothetical protein ZWY2020_000650 [Hordeum vulgare]|nr:hypothetical protein ZWY2020_000650 [Hordeum vulgare]